MYYSAGNYEAFATPKKPANVDGKSAYIVGSGLAALLMIHFTAQYSGVALPLNWYTLGGSAALGVPGVITLLLLQVIIT